MTVYNMNLTDPLHPVSTFVVNPYTANGVRFPTSSLLEQGASSSRTSLLWYGKGSPNYGGRVQENIIHILENFAGASEPVRSLAGQLWFQRRLFFLAGPDLQYDWFVWNDITALWASISSVVVVGAPPDPADTGSYRFDTSSSTLYQKIDIAGHPLNAEWIARVYTEDDSVGDPNAAGIVPHHQVMVQTLGRSGSTDPTNWVSVGNPIASQIEPYTNTPGTLWYDTSDSSLKVYDGTTFDAVVGDYVLRTGDTMTGILVLPASVAGHASIRLPHGTAPGTPADGDMWTTTVGVFAQIDGSTVQLNLLSGFLDDLGDVTIAAPQNRQVLLFDGAGSPPFNEWTNTDLVLTDISDILATAEEVNYLSGVLSSIQDQLDNKLNLFPQSELLGPLNLGGNQIEGVAEPTDIDHAATRWYVDSTNSSVQSGSFDSSSGTLSLSQVNGPTINVPGFANIPTLYEPEENELLNLIPIPANIVTEAVHDLDKIVRRRTSFSRLVTDITSGTTYATPTYEVGTNKLFVFVDGVKKIASTQGYQRVSYPMDPLGSPNETPIQLDCTVPIGDPGLPLFGSPPILYSFELEVDGGAPQEITLDPLLVDSEYTFCNLVAEINSQLVGAHAVLEDSGIVIYSDLHGDTPTTSSIVITDGVSGSPPTVFPLFASLPYFDAIEAPVDGKSYQYSEVGNYGELSYTVEFTLAPTGDFIEFVVCGQSGIPI